MYSNTGSRHVRATRETEMRLLIADDHVLVRDGLKLILGKIEPDITVLECSDYPEALELTEQNQDLDLVILDLNMPGMTGFSGVEAFRSRFPNIPILIISGYYRRRDIVAALQHGAAGFVPKTLGSEAILNAFRLVLSGEKFIPGDLLSDGSPDLDKLVVGGAERDNPLRKLSEREREVLNGLLDGLTNKVIGRNLDIKEVTVKLHCRGIYRKLGAKNRAHAVRIALDTGWRH